jgi:hypothetical protein
LGGRYGSSKRDKSGARLRAGGGGGRLDRGRYFYYQRTHRDVVRIDVPGFQGEISKDKGIDIEFGKQ